MNTIPSLTSNNILNTTEIKQDLGPRLEGGFTENNIHIEEVFYNWVTLKEVSSSNQGNLNVEKVRKITIKRSTSSCVKEGFKAFGLGFIGNGLDEGYKIDDVTRGYIETIAKTTFSEEAINTERDAVRERNDLMKKAFINCQQIVFYASLESDQIEGPVLYDPEGITTVIKVAKVAKIIVNGALLIGSFLFSFLKAIL